MAKDRKFSMAKRLLDTLSNEEITKAKEAIEVLGGLMKDHPLVHPCLGLPLVHLYLGLPLVHHQILYLGLLLVLLHLRTSPKVVGM